MAAHAVASDADPTAVQDLEVCEQCLGKLLSDVSVHVVALVVRGPGCINVETGTAAEIVGIVFALDTEPTCVPRKHRSAIEGCV